MAAATPKPKSSEVKQWQLVAVGRVGLNVSAKKQMSLKDIEHHAGLQWPLAVDFIMSQSDFDKRISREHMLASDMSKPDIVLSSSNIWRKWSEMKTEFNNVLLPAYLDATAMPGSGITEPELQRRTIALVWKKKENERITKAAKDRAKKDTTASAPASAGGGATGVATAGGLTGASPSVDFQARGDLFEGEDSDVVQSPAATGDDAAAVAALSPPGAPPIAAPVGREAPRIQPADWLPNCWLAFLRYGPFAGSNGATYFSTTSFRARRDGETGKSVVAAEKAATAKPQSRAAQRAAEAKANMTDRVVQRDLAQKQISENEMRHLRLSMKQAGQRDAIKKKKLELSLYSDSPDSAPLKKRCREELLTLVRAPDPVLSPEIARGPAVVISNHTAASSSSVIALSSSASSSSVSSSSGINRSSL